MTCGILMMGEKWVKSPSRYTVDPLASMSLNVPLVTQLEASRVFDWAKEAEAVSPIRSPVIQVRDTDPCS
jgi:hypothetical protein